MWSPVRQLIVLLALPRVVPGVQWSVGPLKVPQQVQRAVQPQASRLRFCADCLHLIKHRI
jgi:hypothetical protein